MLTIPSLAIDEELLEPIARYFRFSNGVSFVPAHKRLVVVDLGCGPKIRFFHFLRKRGFSVKKYIGIDPLADSLIIKKYKDHPVISILDQPLEKTIGLRQNIADVVVAFAFFEHIDNPREILLEAYRVVKPGGKIILTVPSPKAKGVLEFLCYRLGIISRREIEEHKRYLDKPALLNLLKGKVKLSQIHHYYFECGLNNLMVITKT